MLLPESLGCCFPKQTFDLGLGVIDATATRPSITVRLSPGVYPRQLLTAHFRGYVKGAHARLGQTSARALCFFGKFGLPGPQMKLRAAPLEIALPRARVQR